MHVAFLEMHRHLRQNVHTGLHEGGGGEARTELHAMQGGLSHDHRLRQSSSFPRAAATPSLSWGDRSAAQKIFRMEMAPTSA